MLKSYHTRFGLPLQVKANSICEEAQPSLSPPPRFGRKPGLIQLPQRGWQPGPPSSPRPLLHRTHTKRGPHEGSKSNKQHCRLASSSQIPAGPGFPSPLAVRKPKAPVPRGAPGGEGVPSAAVEEGVVQWGGGCRDLLGAKQRREAAAWGPGKEGFTVRRQGDLWSNRRLASPARGETGDSSWRSYPRGSGAAEPLGPLR